MHRMAAAMVLFLGSCFVATEPDMCDVWLDQLTHPGAYDLEPSSRRYEQIHQNYSRYCMNRGEGEEEGESGKPREPEEWPLSQDVALPDVPVVWISKVAMTRLIADYREYVVGHLEDAHASAYGCVEADTTLGKRILKIRYVTEAYPLDAPAEIAAVGELVGVVRFAPGLQGPVKRMERGACFVLSRLNPYRPELRFFGFMFADDSDSIAGCVLYKDEQATYRTLMLSMHELHSVPAF